VESSYSICPFRKSGANQAGGRLSVDALITLMRTIAETPAYRASMNAIADLRECVGILALDSQGERLTSANCGDLPVIRSLLHASGGVTRTA
jgi:hypothetical protein